MTNPLLNPNALPAFSDIRPEHVGDAIDKLLSAANTALELVTSDEVPAEYDSISVVLDVATERLHRAWGAVGHLNAVADTPVLRAAYNDKLRAVAEFHARLGANERLYAKYKTLHVSPQAASLKSARRRALDNAIRDFVLSGAELRGDAKVRHAAIQERQAELGQTFSEHVLDATDAFACYVEERDLAGVPADIMQAAQAAARADGKDGYKLTLHFPSYFPVMQYSQNRALREKLYTAYVTRASELGANCLNNTAVMCEILSLRQEEAQLLGYSNYAELSLAPKMADTPAQVCDFLHDLARRARPSAQRDLEELSEFARVELGLPELHAWDMTFAAERLKERRYAFNDQEVKQYLAAPKVLEGLFRIVETLFEVRIREDSAPVWHPSVRFFCIERTSAGEVSAQTSMSADGSMQVVGQFYLDLYARCGKRSGAWMDAVCDRWLRPEGTLQTPVAHLVCNFAPPISVDGVEQPALLTHDDVMTLFHEFGHGLHHMLTQVDDIGVSGICGVEWDAVELPSQFMENFCWEWDVMRRLTAHVETGEVMPRSLFDKMLAAKNFHSGLQMLRQVEMALFDMRIHCELDSHERIQAIADDVRREVAVVLPPVFNRYQNGFLHIFSGGYAAGYYSYKWAEVLSADAWSAFEESGVLDVDTGRRYRESVLETGGSRPAVESFKAFRGREPHIDALLRHQGIT